MTRSVRHEQPFLETPRGIVSRGGLLFHTVAADLERQYGEVLKEMPLEDLIDRAELWLDSHRAITLWVMIPLLAYLPVFIACMLGLIVFVGWKSIAPALGNMRLEYLVRLLSAVPGQLAGYVIAMSWLASTGHYAALVAGLIVFALVRWRLLDYVLTPLSRFLHRRLFPLPVADQMLRAVIHAVAIRSKILLPQFPSIGNWMTDRDKEEKR